MPKKIEKKTTRETLVRNSGSMTVLLAKDELCGAETLPFHCKIWSNFDRKTNPKGRNRDQIKPIQTKKKKN